MEQHQYNSPKVTIITVAYNAQATIEATILSVLAQSYKSLEYIIIDGGSVDRTLQIIKKYEDRISKYISEPDKGIADGFNKGIALATGDWIGMINADDQYTPNAVEVMMNNISKHDDVCCGNIMLIGDNGFKRDKKSKVSWLNFGMYIMHPTCFVKREVYKQVGYYDTGLSIAMDFDMFMRIRCNGFKIKHIDELIVHMSAGGVSGDTTRMHHEELKVMRRHLKGISYLGSFLFNHISRLRWRYFYKDPLRTLAN
ncbi:Glycosyltransferase involved in cell wall bisynthesis [Mucilaginibacter pineti]|uniref:Glycosyltransferase involved in cell wall bisynthesis n=1 Tax=Mucilaginibacter pineti TaxID=1391627 RepID=A0A1G6UEU6_9SPHI|nr:glycosyltransferase family 2 protein [Mucilaginibacter pineti]SDD39779.1 Glycosyltransferase involved in cell wall bisynthesis [Mucilaginibacter pineti]